MTAWKADGEKRSCMRENVSAKPFLSCQGGLTLLGAAVRSDFIGREVRSRKGKGRVMYDNGSVDIFVNITTLHAWA